MQLTVVCPWWCPWLEVIPLVCVCVCELRRSGLVFDRIRLDKVWFRWWSTFFQWYFYFELVFFICRSLLLFFVFYFIFKVSFALRRCWCLDSEPGGVDYNINVKRARIVFLILFFIIVFFGVEWWTKQPPARLLRSCRLLLWILSFQSANNWISKVVRRTNKTKKVLVKCKSFILI